MERHLDALRYAREHLAPWADQYMQEMQRAVATLAFTSKTPCLLYQELFQDAQWQQLEVCSCIDLACVSRSGRRYCPHGAL